MNTQRKVTVVDTPEAAEELEYDNLSANDSQEDLDETAINQTEINDSEQNRSIEDLDDNELLWDNGPNAKMIKAWKKEYEDVYVTSITYDKHIIWRVLTRLEYKQIVKKMEQLVQAGTLSSAEANMWNEEAIAEACILYPKFDKNDLRGAMAGMPSLIAQEVLEASGFVALEIRQL